MRHLMELELLAMMMVVCIITGCASVPTASPEFERTAQSFTPPPGMASVYIYRPYNFVGSGLVLNVTIDDKKLGTLVTNTYLLGNIVPGKHIIKVNSSIERVDSSGIVTQLDAEPGKLYFFKIVTGWWTNFKVEQVVEKDGLHEINYVISSKNLTHEERGRFKNIAIVPARFLPRIDDIRPYYFPGGRMAGAREGAGKGAAAGAYVGLTGFAGGSLFGLLLLPITTTVGTIAGAVSGAVSTDPKKSESEKKSIPKIDKVINQRLRELKIQETMAVRVQEVGKEKTKKELIILQDIGPTSPTDRPDYAALFTQGVDAVLELSVRNIGSEHSSKKGEHLLNFYMNVQARLVFGTESHTREFRYTIEPPRTYDKWVEVGAEAFQKEVDNAYQSLAEKIAEWLWVEGHVDREPEHIGLRFEIGLHDLN
jgi:Protein of unknown function (DUF2846)